eukprot:TRINITY_DN3674_c0_g1_i2.p1 TRINITY_DN3674_c0_g1~~TRINITY_DN3674_c0_g1_i2.p1  ORF type:complete len:1121 (+),score=202.71 TRINITY_DN3674_c0_g1_i2:124-3486(+)
MKSKSREPSLRRPSESPSQRAAESEPESRSLRSRERSLSRPLEPPSQRESRSEPEKPSSRSSERSASGLIPDSVVASKNFLEEVVGLRVDGVVASKNFLEEVVGREILRGGESTTSETPPSKGSTGPKIKRPPMDMNNMMPPMDMDSMKNRSKQMRSEPPHAVDDVHFPEFSNAGSHPSTSVKYVMHLHHAKSALEQALGADTSLPWRRGRLVLLGQGRAGKTSTVRSLTGRPFNSDEASTLGLETASCEIQRHDAVDWQVNNEPLPETAGLIMQLLGEEKISAPKKGRSMREAGESISSVDRVSTDLTQELRVEEVVKNMGADMVMSRKVHGQPITFSTWDFGGQEVFHSLHHLFLSRYSVYLVVFNMADLLCSTSEEAGAGACQRRSAAMDNLRYWLNSIALHANGAPVILVGTRKDEIKNAAAHRKISDLLWEKFQLRLSEQVYPNTQIQPDGEGLWFFPIDNTLSGSRYGKSIARDPVVSDLQTAIEAAAREDPLDYLERQIPVKWRGVLDILTELGRDKHVLKLQEVKDVADRQGMPEWQVLGMLELFHELGVLIHFSTPMELRDTVIIQPQWLVDGICRVIFDWDLHEREFHKQLKLENKTAYDSWKDKGVLAKRLLDRLWADGSSDPSHRVFLVNFMVQVALLCEVDADIYIVPSLLPAKPADFGWQVSGATRGEDLEDSNAALEDSNAAMSFAPAKRGYRRFWLDFSEFFLPDGLFKRLLCFAVEKCNTSQASEKELYATAARLSWGEYSFYLTAILEHDMIEIEAVCSDKGPWLVLHIIKGLIDSLQHDFMKGIKYEILFSSTEQNRVKVRQADVEQARGRGLSKFRPRGSTVLLSTADFDDFFNVEDSQPPDVLVESQWRQLKNTWGFLEQHEHKYGPKERAALFRYLRDPGKWGISWSALETIEEEAKQSFGSDYQEKSMWHVVKTVVKPQCTEHGAPLALVQNNWQVLSVEDFVTHSWREPFHEFMDSLRHAYDVRVVKPNLFICAFALFQGKASDIKEALGQSISQAPFVKALAASERFVVVRNRVEDLYTRAWCLVEFLYAKKLGFYKERVLITGPNDFSASTSSTEIKASSEEDRLKILKFIIDEGGPAVIDPQIAAFRAFDAGF